MRRFFSIPLLLFLLTFCLVSFSKGEETTVLRPQNTDEALINPGMGWVCFHYSNRLWAYGSLQGPGDTLDWFPGCSTIYFRIPWCYLEPEEGKFRWDLIDSRARSWIEKGKKIAFRITASENRFVYATPKWVKDAGAQGVFYRFPFDRYAKMLPQTSKDASGKTVVTYPKTPEAKDLWDPKFDDPVFLAKLDKFLAAMAKRYNGNPDVSVKTDFRRFDFRCLTSSGRFLQGSRHPNTATGIQFTDDGIIILHRCRGNNLNITKRGAVVEFDEAEPPLGVTSGTYPTFKQNGFADLFRNTGFGDTET